MWKTPNIATRHPYISFCVCLAVIDLPQWFQSVWGFFRTDAPIPVIRDWLSKLNVTVPLFSAYWITIPLGIGMFIFLLLELRSQKTALNIRQTGEHSLARIAGILYPKQSWFETWVQKTFPPKMMPMSEAVRHLYDQTHDTELGFFIRRNFDDIDKQLRCLARYVVGTSVPVFAKRPGGASLILVDKDKLKSGSFHSSGDSFAPHGTMGVPTLIDVSIYRRDLQKAIREITALGVADSDAEKEFQDAFDRAAFERNKASRDAALLRLAQLRTAGVAIRNEAEYVQDDSLQLWLESVETWMHEVIDVIWQINVADSEWFKTLDAVPPPRIPINSLCKKQTNPGIHLNVYRQHDLRLVRLEQLLRKHGVAA